MCWTQAHVCNLRSLATFPGGTHDGDDEFANAHRDSAPEQQAATSEFLDHVEGSRGSRHIDNVHDGRNQEGVLKANLLEEGGSVVD